MNFPNLAKHFIIFYFSKKIPPLATFFDDFIIKKLILKQKFKFNKFFKELLTQCNFIIFFKKFPPPALISN